MRTGKILGISLILIVVSIIFREILFQSKVAVPADTLVGAYFPWLDFKWGFVVGVPVKNALLSDSFSHFFIYKHLVADLVKEGIMPLWNKYSLSGTPLLATYHTNPFFPANLLLLLPKFTGWNLFIFSSTLCACLSMYLFLNKKISNIYIKVIASLVYAFSGPMTTWSEFGTAVWAAAIIPLILYLIEEIVIFQRKYAYSLFSISVALLLFAGHLQIDTYAMVIIPSYVLYLTFSHQTKNKLSILAKLFFFGAIGIGISLIELLPVYELFTRSIRGEENYAQSFHYGLVDFPQLIRLFVPDFFGHPTTGNQWSEFIYHEYTSFLGTLSLPFIIASFFVRTKKAFHQFFGYLFISSLLLVTLNPISSYIFSLPLPLLTFSSASRLFFVTGLSGSILVALGIDYFLLESGFKRKVSLTSLALVTIIGIALYFVPPEYKSIAIRNSLIPTALLVGLFLVGKINISKTILVIILFLIFAFDLGRYYRKYNPFVGENLVFPLTPIISFLNSQEGLYRVGRENTNLFPPNTWAYYKLESIEGYEPLRPLNYNRLFHLFENNKFFSRAGRYSELNDIDPKYLSLMNVRYFSVLNSSLTKKKPISKLIEYGYFPIFSDKSITVLKNPHALDRAFFIDKIIGVKTDQELAAVLEDKSFDPLTTAVITQTPPNIGLDKLRYLILKFHGDNNLILESKSSADQFIVISDTFDQGWNAYIDDKPVDLYQVDGALRGLFVPKGEHRITMEYKPYLFTIGLRLTLASILILFITIIYYLYERRTSSKL